jgi:hypothetical protein
MHLVSRLHGGHSKMNCLIGAESSTELLESTESSEAVSLPNVSNRLSLERA